ncbi:hypothetical protein HPB49_015119 [Dermacentor silvarum]|uniref:Uncharacterized protein n=1 Tax=Dermacentor silvarum TaxID=543639 RepID=A0ACB8CXU7_DERSI|nr:hypothetical protein HPB49_015119 [Dermacentor silvarum]
MLSTLSKPDPSERTEHVSTPSREGEFPATYTFKAWNFDADLSAQSPKCATAASEPDIDTTSAHTHKNGGAGTAACLTQMNTTNVAFHAL